MSAPIGNAMVDSTVRTLMDFTARSFHFRQALDACVSLIARLQSYAVAPTKRADDAIKIRQDILATADIVQLALHLRRFAEITRSTTRMKSHSLEIMSWADDGKFQPSNASIYDIVSRVIHSNTCATCRNLMHVAMHFGARAPTKDVLKGPLGTKPILVIESGDKAKIFLSLINFLDAAYKLVDVVAQNDKSTREYLSRRKI